MDGERVIGASLRPGGGRDGEVELDDLLRVHRRVHLVGPDEAALWPHVLAAPGLIPHLYGKAEARPGRKMGHVTRLFPRGTLLGGAEATLILPGREAGRGRDARAEGA